MMRGGENIFIIYTISCKYLRRLYDSVYTFQHGKGESWGVGIHHGQYSGGGGGDLGTGKENFFTIKSQQRLKNDC